MTPDALTLYLRELEAERRHTRPSDMPKPCGTGRADPDDLKALVDAVCPVSLVREAS
jgi:hypothetical protein